MLPLTKFVHVIVKNNYDMFYKSFANHGKFRLLGVSKACIT